MNQLVINPYINNILSIIYDNPFSIINVPPCCGTPLFISMSLIELSTNPKVAIVFPDNVSLQQVSNYLLYLNPNLKITQLSGNMIIGSDDQFIITNSSYIGKQLISLYSQYACSPFSLVDYLIIADFYPDNLSVELIVSMWSHCHTIRNKVPHISLIGTIPPNLFQVVIDRYTDKIHTDLLTFQPSNKIFNVFTTYYPIDIIFNNKNYQLYDETIVPDIITIISNLNNTPYDHNVLVLTPSPQISQQVMDSLSTIHVTGINLDEFQWGLSNENISAQNILVSSTLPIYPLQVSIVIDTMIIYGTFISTGGGLRVGYNYISKDESSIRRSVLGIYNNGIYYAMCNQKFYNNLQVIPTPNILKEPIFPYIGLLQQSQLSPTDMFPSVHKQLISSYQNLFEHFNIIEPSTNKLHFINKIPLGLRNSIVLWEYIQLMIKGVSHISLPKNHFMESIPFNLYAIIVILSLIDSYDITLLWFPLQQSNQSSGDYQLVMGEQYSRFYQKFMGASDLYTLCNIWNSLLRDNPTILDEAFDLSDIVKWARLNGINQQPLIDIYNIINKIINMISSYNFEIEPKPFDVQNAILSIRPLLQKAYYNSIVEIQGNDTSPRYQLVSMKRSPDCNKLYQLNPYIPSLFKFNPPKKIIMVSSRYQQLQPSIILLGLDYDPQLEENIQL